MLSLAIVGLPNVGKSTIFKALTSAPAEASNYPFTTIDPNVGIVTVPDERLERLTEVVKPKKTVPTAIEFVDVAGLIKGASQGEGLGNQFLANIRETDAIAEVVRFFEDPDVIHVEGAPNPDSDTETIALELALADLATVEKRAERLKKEVRANPKLSPALDSVEKVRASLEQGMPARLAGITEDDLPLLRDMHLLTMKPHIYIANVSEEQLAAILKGEAEITSALQRLKDKLGSDVIPICAKVEAELAELDDEEAAEYRDELGYHESGLATVIKESYKLLGLISYFTAGEQEVRAWTIRRGTKAPQAAGVIHTDFEKGFIKAEVIGWQELVEVGSLAGAKAVGTLRIEGKDYVFQDGDVALFRFNV